MLSVKYNPFMLSAVMLSVKYNNFMLSDIMLSVAMLSVIRLSVVAP
jgi:hypothetical protein